VHALGVDAATIGVSSSRMWSGYGEAVSISPAHVAVGGNGIKIAVTLIENAAPFATDSGSPRDGCDPAHRFDGAQS